MIGVNSKSAPSVFGVQRSMIAPCGTYTNPIRVPEFVAACAVMAGIIDSRNGNASVAPAPCKNVRRERCFLVMNIAAPSKRQFGVRQLNHLNLKCNLGDLVV